MRYLKKIRSPQYIARQKYKKLVFTNGCFDILHAGHVRYLYQARTFGDALVVAVNSDLSVRKIKGSRRPINKLKDRMEVLAGLGCVDFVTWFSEDHPKKVILKIRPKVLVKGGDYQPSKIIGSREVKSWGGSVRVVRFLKGRSTTKVLKKISDAV